MKQYIIDLAKKIKNLLINPKYYFSKIVADGNLEDPIIRSFLYGLLGGLIYLFFKYINGVAINFYAIFISFILIPTIATTLLFLMGGLLMLVSEITGGERDWEIAIKGLSSIFFIYPIIVWLNMLASDCTSIWIISLIVDSYVLFLFYNISLYCMKGKKTNIIIFICILLLLIIGVYATDYRIPWFILKNAGAGLKCL